MPLPKSNERYTYADYLTWDEDVRCELVNGEVVDLASPSTAHQIVLSEIFFQIRSYLEGKRCIPMIAPADVLLFAKQSDAPDDVDTVVQPDLYIVCDPTKLHNSRGCIGAPDMVLEVTSPSTSGYDLVVKRDLYAKAGVQEYWAVDPVRQEVTVLLLDIRTDSYITKAIYSREDSAKVEILNNCHVDLPKVFSKVPEEATPSSLPKRGSLHNLQL